MGRVRSFIIMHYALLFMPVSSRLSIDAVFSHFLSGEFFDFGLIFLALEVCIGSVRHGDDHASRNPFVDVIAGGKTILKHFAGLLQVESCSECLCHAESGFIVGGFEASLAFGEKTDVVKGRIKADGIEFETITDHKDRPDNFGQTSKTWVFLTR